MASDPSGTTPTSSRKYRKPLRVLVVRHGIAEEATAFAATGAPDGERPLTKQGRRKMRRAARGLAVLLPDVRTIASSPLSRAVETAEILLDRYSKQGDEPQLQQLAALAPGRPANQLLSWLGDRPREGVCVIVGHEPYLSQFICWTLTGVRESFVELKKGAACLLQFDQEVRPGKGKMLWAMRPGQLRKMCGAE